MREAPSATAEVTASVSVAIIGIAAGGGCDGQILVSHDMLGICTRFNPRFVRRYADMGVSRLIVPLPALGRGNPIDNLKAFSDNVIAKIATTGS